MELSILSIQIETLLESYLTDFLPKAETRPATTPDIYQAFPGLPEAGLRTRIEYFREMGLTSEWSQTQKLWSDAAKSHGPCFNCLTNWGSVVFLIPALPPEEQNHYVLLSQFLCAANVSCFADTGGHRFSAVADVAALIANWPKKPVTNDDVKYDISPLYYRLLEKSNDATELRDATKAIIDNSPMPVNLKWKVKNGLANAAGQAQSLPGFSSVSVAGAELRAQVDLSAFIRNKVSGTVAFPFGIPRGDYDPTPKARYPNYLFDQWINCRKFSGTSQHDGAEMLRLWDEELQGHLADVIESQPNPLLWLRKLGDALTGQNKVMVKNIQGELKKLIDDALKQLEGATKPTRVPLEFEGTLFGPVAVPMDSNEFAIEIDKGQVAPADWNIAESIAENDLIFLQGEVFRSLAITRVGADKINIKVEKGGPA